jgi:transcriptional regulator with XRE-family HTH domain
MDNLTELVGNRIRNLRKDKGWSQEELAHASGLHVTYIGKLERSEHQLTLESLSKITKALNISLEQFFHGIQASQDGKYNDTLAIIINKLQKLSSDEQRKALKLLELVFNWNID